MKLMGALWITLAVGLAVVLSLNIAPHPARAQTPCLPGAPIASCVLPPGPSAAIVGFDFYKRVGNVPAGAYTEIGDLITLPETVGWGYVVFIDRGSITNTADTNDRTNWINVLHFPNN